MISTALPAIVAATTAFVDRGELDHLGIPSTHGCFAADLWRSELLAGTQELGHLCSGHLSGRIDRLRHGQVGAGACRRTRRAGVGGWRYPCAFRDHHVRPHHAARTRRVLWPHCTRIRRSRIHCSVGTGAAGAVPQHSRAPAHGRQKWEKLDLVGNAILFGSVTAVLIAAASVSARPVRQPHGCGLRTSKTFLHGVIFYGIIYMVPHLLPGDQRPYTAPVGHLVLPPHRPLHPSRPHCWSAGLGHLGPYKKLIFIGWALMAGGVGWLTHWSVGTSKAEWAIFSDHSRCGHWDYAAKKLRPDYGQLEPLGLNDFTVIAFAESLRYLPEQLQVLVKKVYADAISDSFWLFVRSPSLGSASTFLLKDLPLPDCIKSQAVARGEGRQRKRLASRIPCLISSPVGPHVANGFRSSFETRQRAAPRLRTGSSRWFKSNAVDTWAEKGQRAPAHVQQHVQARLTVTERPKQPANLLSDAVRIGSMHCVPRRAQTQREPQSKTRPSALQRNAEWRRLEIRASKTCTTSKGSYCTCWYLPNPSLCVAS
ncbi:hypothetical protein L1887_61873 [Cichorium endivia]|nr:hypothetical protein L1887_61873 [Cichorium endivia]